MSFQRIQSNTKFGQGLKTYKKGPLQWITSEVLQFLVD